MRGQLPAHARTVQKRDHLWAMLVAAGVYSWGEIAAATGERLDYLEQKAQTVPFQALVEEYRRRFTPIDTDEQEIARKDMAHPLNIRDHPALDHKRKLVLERILV